MKHILSYGGGINSTAMYFLIKKQGLPLDEIVFADTGDELPETYLVVEKLKNTAEASGDKFTVVRSHLADSLYDYCMKKKIVPSRMKRDCTDKFKISPIRKHLRTAYGKGETFTMYIGIAQEEATRMRSSDVAYITNAYPLVDSKINRNGCVKILNEHRFENVPKSGCFYCPFTKKDNWIKLHDEQPILFRRAMELEENVSDRRFMLTSIPLSELFEKRKNQTKLKDYEHTCDVAGSCFL